MLLSIKVFFFSPFLLAELPRMLWNPLPPGMIQCPVPGDPRTPPAKCPTVGGRATGGFLQYAQLMNPRNSMSITNTKGLLNMPGQNNCFLNSAVQVNKIVYLVIYLFIYYYIMLWVVGRAITPPWILKFNLNFLFEGFCKTEDNYCFQIGP